MLTGKELGDALRIAIEKKQALWQGLGRGRLPKKEIASHFHIQPPSLNDWENFGRIGKQHLNELVAYFSDVVAPSHWGIDAIISSREIVTTNASKSEDDVSPDRKNVNESVQRILIKRAELLAERLVQAARDGALSEQAVDGLESRFETYVGRRRVTLRIKERDLDALSGDDGHVSRGRRGGSRK